MGRTDYIYFIIDISNSMQGAKIGAVNDAINNIVHGLKKVVNSMEIDIKLIVMTFAENTKWSGILPVSLDSFLFEDLIVEENSSNLGQALSELNDKLQKQETVQDSYGKTIIILFSDGLATDDYKEPINKLNANKLFRKSDRIVYTYGTKIYDLIKEPLCMFAGNEENVIVDDFLSLNKMLFEKYR